MAELFEDLPERVREDAVPMRTHGGARPGAGRKPGAVAKISRDLRTYLRTLTGVDAIVEQYQLAATPLVGDDGKAIRKLAQDWKCTPIEAVDRVLKAGGNVFRHVYPSLGQLGINRGAPGNPLQAEDVFGALLEGEWWPTESAPSADVESGQIQSLDEKVDEPL